jgi:hypothetical protein
MRLSTLPIFLTLLAWANSPSTASAQLKGLDDSDEKVRTLAAKLDATLAKAWTERSIQPAAYADDAEYLRRVYLDVLGRTPRVAETRQFLTDGDADKRTKMVAKLVQMPAYAVHFAAQTRVEWLPSSGSDFRILFAANNFENWLKKQYTANVPADVMARRLMTAEVSVGQRGKIQNRNERQEQEQIELGNFYTANDGKPETIASTFSRTMLGVKIECAQCHDHPFAPYTREQFWQFTAFFGEFTSLSPISPSFVGPHLPQTDLNQIEIPNSPKIVSAAFFDGTSPTWSGDRTPREELARWMTDRSNPYFARNLSNRLWAHFFGIGIIDPVDEPGSENPPSHPELLDELAKCYIECNFDTRLMVRIITATRAYNLTSRQSDKSHAEPRSFARMNVRGLSGPQIYESFLAATGLKEDNPRNQNNFFNNNATQGRFAFNTQFGLSAIKPTEAQTSILQSLMMMNGLDMNRVTTLNQGETLTAVVEAPFMSTASKVETLYLAAVGRKPTPNESQAALSTYDRAGKPAAKNQALADLFWVLLNSPEFVVNK